MSYWYPTQARTAALEAELNLLERLSSEQIRRLAKPLAPISHTLDREWNTEGFPQHQIGQWTWLASQFRMLAEADEAEAVIAGAALDFLGKHVKAGKIDSAVIQDLNWVLDSTLRRLRGKMRPERFRSYLTSEELSAIESRLAQFASVPEFDVDAIRQPVQKQIGELAALSLNGRIDGVVAKVDTLFEAAARSDKEGAAARAALLYLADEDDLARGTLGVLDLLDDVCVIDWAYAVVKGLTRCLPLLLAFLDQWPFVADLALAGAPPMPLGRFGQYIACAFLNSLFGERQPALLIVRESAGYGAIAALFAAVQCARLQADELDAEIGTWRAGQPVIVSDGLKKFKASFIGIEMLGDKPKIRLGVRKSGSLTVDMSIAPYIASSDAPHKLLCDGSAFSVWLKNRHIDPLVTLTGFGRRKLYQQECVMLLGPRHKLDDYFSCLRPFGTSASALLGARYVSADLTQHDLDYETSDTPFIYACSDPATACDLITKPPAHVSRWRVIVDGARAGRTLRALLQTSPEYADVPICIIGELHEREAAVDLLRGGMAIWYLENQDVEISPPTTPHANDEDDLLTKSLRRSGGHWAQTMNVRIIRNDFLECAEACLGKRKSSGDSEAPTQALEYAVAAFIRKATSCPCGSPEIEHQLGDEARKIAGQASVLSLFDTRAAEILALFRRWTISAPPRTDRQSELIDLIESIPPSLSVAILCRSERVAERCKAITETHPKLNRVIWANLGNLRKSAPYDCVVIPGWLDKMSMREIANNGYAGRLELILCPFEQRWFDSMCEASRNWERRLEEETATSLRQLHTFSKLKTGSASLWLEQVEERVGAVNVDPRDDRVEESDSPVFEEIEARAIAAVLQKRIDYGKADHPTASAQLVLFEEDGAYAFLPPGGRVIVLADADGPLDKRLLHRSGAERMLLRRVSMLELGMVLAFSSGDDRDLVDARADQFVRNAAAVREMAGMWKNALKRYLKPTTASYADFSRRMELEGERRDPYTVRTWATHTNSIAPRNYRILVPLIAKLTGDLYLQQRMPQVLTAIDLIYRARAEAADAIVREIFSGEIDVNAAQLSFELNGVSIRYFLHRVRELGGVQQVPIELIGKIGSLSDEPIGTGSSELVINL